MSTSLSFSPSVAPLLDVLDLHEKAPDVFVGNPQILPSGRVYGGELVAQAAAAGSLTVDHDRRIHSLHGYFLRAGDVHEPTRWEVERLRDGRGFSRRVIRGLQGDRELFRAMASFQVPASPFAERGTGIGRARLYSQDGTLLASVGQEGVVRLP